MKSLFLVALLSTFSCADELMTAAQAKQTSVANAAAQTDVERQDAIRFAAAAINNATHLGKTEIEIYQGDFSDAAYKYMIQSLISHGYMVFHFRGQVGRVTAVWGSR